MKNLIIINGGGFGREIYWHTRGLQDRGTEEEKFALKGFLDNRPGILQDSSIEHPLLGSVEDYIVQGEDVFICAISDPAQKKIYTDIILAKGGEFINLMHPDARVSYPLHIGKGVIIASNVGVSNNTYLDDFVTINSSATIGHDTKIGKYSHINTAAVISGNVTIGDFVQIHANATILPKVTIGNNTVVGAGSVVIKNIKANSTVFGVPAMELKF